MNTRIAIISRTVNFLCTDVVYMQSHHSPAQPEEILQLKSFFIIILK